MAMTLRLTDDETRALRDTAEREHRSMQEVARAAVVEYTSRRASRRDELLAQIKAQYGEAFERLADL